MSFPPLSDEEVADFVLSLAPIERSMMRHFVEKRGRTYRAIADKAGVTYSQVQALGHKLQSARLAYVEVIPYDGRRLFLNHRGEQAKRAADILNALESSRAQPVAL